MNMVSFIFTYMYIILGIVFLTGAAIIISKKRERTDKILEKVGNYFGLRKVDTNKFSGIYNQRKTLIELFKQGGKEYLAISMEFRESNPKQGLYFAILLTNPKAMDFHECFIITGTRIPEISEGIKTVLMSLKNHRYFTKKSMLFGYMHNTAEIVFLGDRRILTDINAIKEILEIQASLCKSLEEMKEFTKVIL